MKEVDTRVDILLIDRVRIAESTSSVGIFEACLRANENYTARAVPATPWFDASIH